MLSVMALLATLLTVVPDAVTNEVAAKPAPVLPLPPCVNDQGQSVGFCEEPNPEASATASGTFKEGSTVKVELSPSVPACDTWDKNGTGLWSPSKCYNSIDIRTADCWYEVPGSGQFLRTSCPAPEGEYRANITTNWHPRSPECTARGAFSVYYYGGPANVPGGKWAEFAPDRLTCEFTWNSTSAVDLPGPTWMRVRASVGGIENGSENWGTTAYAYVPIEGELANPGPDAAFITEDLGDGRFRFKNETTHEHNLAMTYEWDLGGETSTAKSPTRTFAKPGNYDIELTAKDSLGLTDTVSRRVQVPAPSLGASITLGTKSGTGAVELNEEFDVTLRVATGKGVGAISDITAGVPFANANASGLERVSGPESIAPFTLQPDSHQDFTWKMKAASAGRFTLRSTPSGTDAAGRAVQGNTAEANGSTGGFTVEVIPPEETVQLEPKTDGERDENGQLIDPGFEPGEVPVILRVSVPENGVAITDVKPFETVAGDGGIDVVAVRKSKGLWTPLIPQPLPFPVTWTGPSGTPAEEGAEPPALPIERIDPGQSVDLALELEVKRPGNYEVESIIEALTAPNVGEPKTVRAVGKEVVPIAGEPVLAVEIRADRIQGSPPRMDEGETAHFTGSVKNLSLTDTIDLRPIRPVSLGQGVVTGPVELTEDFPEPGFPAIFDPVLEPDEEVVFKIAIETTSLPGLDWELLTTRESVVLDLVIEGEAIDPDGARRDLDPETDYILDAGNGKWTNGIRVEVDPKLNPQPLLEVSDIVYAVYGESAESVARAGKNFVMSIPSMLKAMPSLAGAIAGGTIDLAEANGEARVLQMQYAWAWAEQQAQIVLGLPAEDKQAILDEISADLAKLYEEEYGPISNAVNQGVESFFTGVLEYKGAADRAGRTGDVQALVEMTGDAVEVVSQVVIEEVTGQAVMLWLARTAKSERVARAIAKARENLNVEEVRKLEAATDEMRAAQANPKVAPASKAIKDVAPGTPVSSLQAIRGWAIDAVSDANLRRLTGSDGRPIMVAIRSRADETLEWMETALGITPKPVTIKPKNVNLDDCNFLGYRCTGIGYAPDGTRSLGDMGSVAMREPLSRPEVIRRLDAAGVDGITRDRVLLRHNKRWKEWYGVKCPGSEAHCVVPEIPVPSKWTEMKDKTPHVVIGEDGLRTRMGELDVPRQGHPPEPRDNFDTAGKPGVYDKRAFELREVRLEDGKPGWEVWLEDKDGVLKRVSGDIDTVSVTDINGRSLPPDSDYARDVALELQEAMDAQHPWSSSLANPELREDFLKPHLWDPDPLKRGEPLLVYVNGEARVGWFDPAKYSKLLNGTDTDPLASMLWLEGGPNNLDAIAKRQVDLRQKIVDPQSVPTPQGHVKVEGEVRSALLDANQKARVGRNAAEIQKTADRYATCAIKTSRAPRATAAVWRMSDRLQKRRADGTWADTDDPGEDCDGGEIIVLPETAILTDVLAGDTVLPIIEDLLGFDWKDMFRIGDCITIDAGLPNEESACITEHGSLVLDRPLQFDHDRLARVIMDTPGPDDPGDGSGGEGGTDGSGSGSGGSEPPAQTGCPTAPVLVTEENREAAGIAWYVCRMHMVGGPFQGQIYFVLLPRAYFPCPNPPERRWYQPGNEFGGWLLENHCGYTPTVARAWFGMWFAWDPPPSNWLWDLIWADSRRPLART